MNPNTLTMNTEHFIPAEFLGTPLTIIDRDGQKWLTAEEVGRCLGYNDANSRIGVQNLYNRHTDDFTETDTCVIKLITQGQARATRIFSATGCVALGWLANTPRAKQFKQWAKQALVAQLTGQASHLTKPPRKWNGRPLISRELERVVLERFAAGWGQGEIARALGTSKSTVNRICLAKHQFLDCMGPSQCTPQLLDAVAARHLEIERGRLLQFHQRLAEKLRADANNQPLAERLDAIGQGLAQAPAAARLLDGPGAADK
jgi:transcriptional regulator with XRE-family HTH domain